MSKDTHTALLLLKNKLENYIKISNEFPHTSLPDIISMEKNARSKNGFTYVHR